MKIINEKGKLFGIINVIDLLVLIAIIGLSAGILCKIFGSAIRDVTAETSTMNVVYRIRGASQFLVNELNRNSQIGKKMVSGNEYVDATITEVWFEDYVVQVTTDDGKILDAVDPTKKDIMVRSVSDVAKNTPTPKIGTQEVRAGRTFIVKTNDFETGGYVESVVFE